MDSLITSRRCETSLECIPDYKECDGVPDCDDESDENSEKCDRKL